MTGLLLGALGVGLVAKVGGADVDASFLRAVVACLIAAMCYALTGVYLKLRAARVKPMAMAGASQAMAGLALLPLALASPPAHTPGAAAVLSVIALAVLCSAVAYVLYFRLIAGAGPSRAVAVT